MHVPADVVLRQVWRSNHRVPAAVARVLNGDLELRPCSDEAHEPIRREDASRAGSKRRACRSDDVEIGIADPDSLPFREDLLEWPDRVMSGDQNEVAEDGRGLRRKSLVRACGLLHDERAVPDEVQRDADKLPPDVGCRRAFGGQRDLDIRRAQRLGLPEQPCRLIDARAEDAAEHGRERPDDRDCCACRAEC